MEENYSILKHSKIKSMLQNNESIKEIATEYDGFGYMPKSVGEELENLNEEGYIVGIHRTGYTIVTKDMINDLFTQGLTNNGDIMIGINNGKFNIEKTVSFYENFLTLYGQIKAASGYKNSQGCVIVKIPKSYIGKAEGEIKPIYWQNKELVKLLPEFIYGYIPVSKKAEVSEIVRNPNYKNVHQLNNVNLKYDDYADNVGTILMDISIQATMLFNAYQDTYMKYGEKQANGALLSLIENHEIKYFSGDANRKNLDGYVNFGDIYAMLEYILMHETEYKQIVPLEGLLDIYNKHIDSGPKRT